MNVQQIYWINKCEVKKSNSIWRLGFKTHLFHLLDEQQIFSSLKGYNPLLTHGVTIRTKLVKNTREDAKTKWKEPPRIYATTTGKNDRG